MISVAYFFFVIKLLSVKRKIIKSENMDFNSQYSSNVEEIKPSFTKIINGSMYVVVPTYNIRKTNFLIYSIII